MCHDDRARAQEILIEAQNYYNAMYRFRKDRERNKRYNYGDQWGDVVCVDGKKMTEEQYILSQGNIPLKTNLIRRLVRDWRIQEPVDGADLYCPRPRRAATGRNDEYRAAIQHAVEPYDGTLCPKYGGVSDKWHGCTSQVVWLAQ